jgi:hypothetical protein
VSLSYEPWVSFAFAGIVTLLALISVLQGREQRLAPRWWVGLTAAVGVVVWSWSEFGVIVALIEGLAVVSMLSIVVNASARRRSRAVD